MPERETLARARQAAREGKAPPTQAGEFFREEIEHIREGARQPTRDGMDAGRDTSCTTSPASFRPPTRATSA